MKDKWSKFKHANTSNLDIVSPDKGSASIQGDWCRALNNELLINGVPITTIGKAYNNFATKDNVISFFNEVILKDFVGNESQKAQALDYLKETFHQGGLLYPVSSSLATSIKDENGMAIGTIRDSTKDQKINIETTPQGFKIQEFVTVGEVFSMQDIEKAPTILKAEKGAEHLIEAQGTVNVDFSKNSKEPTLTVESNQMNINNSALNKIMDKRGLGQIIVDFLKNLVGMNKVKDISSEKKTEIKPDSPAPVAEEASASIKLQ